MTPWERKVWDSDNLTAFVLVLVVSAVTGALTLVGWCINLLGGFDRLKAWWWRY